MSRRNKNILLLVDNAGPHGREPPELSNVTLKYLPPSTTSHLHPLDAGIIAAFKAHYRKLFLFNLIAQYDGKISEKKMSLKEAVDFLVDAWSAAGAETIQNCWRHTGILEDGQREAQRLDIDRELQTEVQVLINQLDIERAQKLAAMEYIGVDESEPALEFLSDKEIVEFINKRHDNDNESDDNDSEDEPPLPPLSTQQGKAALETALRYCEEQTDGEVDSKFLAKLRALIRDAAKKIQDEKKQLTLDKFLN